MIALADAVDVVIVTYNSSALLPESIGAVRQWPRCGCVIVVDNASEDGSAAVARDWADVVCQLPENLGYGAGQNVGFQHVESPWFLALNPDAMVVPAGLDVGVLGLEMTPDIAMVQGTVRSAIDGSPERTIGPEPGLAELISHRLGLRSFLSDAALGRAAALIGKTYYRDRQPSAALDSAFLAMVAPLVRSAAFHQVGGFDERFFLYAEDVDLGRRLRDAGWRLRALPDDWAVHLGAASTSGQDSKREDYWRRGHAQLAATHWTGWRRRAARWLVGTPDDR